jgi:hypothetical protein
MFIGPLEEAFAPYEPDVPSALFVTSGVVGGLLSAALVLAGVMELIARAQAKAAIVAHELGRTRGASTVQSAEARWAIEAVVASPCFSCKRDSLYKSPYWSQRAASGVW